MALPDQEKRGGEDVVMKEALVRVWMFITASLWMAGAVLVIVADEFAMANRIVFGIALALSLLLALAKRKEVAQQASTTGQGKP